MATVEVSLPDSYQDCVIVSPFGRLVGDLVDAAPAEENHGGLMVAAQHLGLFIFRNKLGGFNVETQSRTGPTQLGGGVDYVVDRVILGKDDIVAITRKTSTEIIGARGERNYEISVITLDPPATAENDELGILPDMTEKLKTLIAA